MELPKFEIPTFELPFELPKFELPFELPSFDLPKFELPFELPSFDLPKFDLPKVELPDVDLPSAEQIAGAVRDAAYVGIGLAVMTAERLQALQAQLVEALGTQVAKVGATV